MPRSFLVKKHINSAKKPNYSELESPTGKIFKLLFKLSSPTGSMRSAGSNFSSCLHVFSVLQSAHLPGPPSARHPPAGDPEPGCLQPHHGVDDQQPAAVAAPQ